MQLSRISAIRRLSAGAALLCLLATDPARADVRAYWTFDDTTSDLSGNGLNGTLFGDAGYSTIVPAALGTGKSLNLDGVGDYFLVDVTGGSLAGPYTFSAWVRNADYSANSFISTRNSAAGGGEHGFDAKFQTSTTARVHGDIGTASSWLNTAADAPINYSLDTWYHVAYVVSSNGYQIFIDGAQAGSGTFAAATPLLWDASHDISIGKYLGNGSEDFYGQIDNVAVYNHGLSSSQVLQLSTGVAPASLGAALVNGSFEANSFSVFPGYISTSGNAPIIGWTTDNPGRVGLNPAGGSPFADNGATPDGANVAFIQNSAGTGYLQTTLDNLVSGVTYRVSYDFNGRTHPAGRTHPQIRATVDTAIPTLLQNDVQYAVVGGTNPYFLGAYEFTATAPSHTLRFENTRGTSDSAVLLDDVRVETAAEATGWTTYRWTGDADSGIDSTLKYSHAIDLGNAGSPAINGVTFKGSGTGNNPAEGAGGANYSTVLSTRYTSTDSNAVTSAGGGSGSLATYFVYGGTTQSIALAGLIPGRRYKTSLYSVGWADPAPSTRAAKFTVNGDELVTHFHTEMGIDQGMRKTWRGDADADGRIVFTDIPLGAGTWHFYGFANQADPRADEILATSFAGLNGTANGGNITAAAAAPDYVNRPGDANWLETGLNNSYHVDIQNGVARLGPNAGGAISIASSGGYTKPDMLRLSADVQIGTIVGTDYLYARGVGLGFYSNGTYAAANQEVRVGFTGLVLGPDGGLYKVEGGTADTVNRVAFGGTFSASQFYNLSYDIDLLSGAIANIVLEGSTADYSGLTSAAFTGAATEYAGFFGSSASGSSFGYADNFLLTVIPEPSTILLLAVAGAIFWRSRRRPWR